MIKFYAEGDDTVKVERDGRTIMDAHAFNSGWGVSASFLVGDSLIVHAIIDPYMNWSFSASQVPGVPMRRDWKIFTTSGYPDHDNTTVLYIDGCEDVVVRELDRALEQAKAVTEAGLYRVRVIRPPEGHDFEGVHEFLWYCNHRKHAVNKANKRHLSILSIEKVEED